MSPEDVANYFVPPSATPQYVQPALTEAPKLPPDTEPAAPVIPNIKMPEKLTSKMVLVAGGCFILLLICGWLVYISVTRGSDDGASEATGS